MIHHRDQIISHLKMSLEFVGKTGQIKNVYNVPSYNRNVKIRKNQNGKPSSKLHLPISANQLILDAANNIKVNTFLQNVRV